MHATRAALAGVATDMGACQVQMFAQEMDQQHTRLNSRADRFSVYRECDVDAIHD
jgi:hypothetical protein